MSTLLLIVLVILLLGALPAWPYSRDWGYYPTGGLGLLVIVLLVWGISKRPCTICLIVRSASCTKRLSAGATGVISFCAYVVSQARSSANTVSRAVRSAAGSLGSSSARWSSRYRWPF